MKRRGMLGFYIGIGVFLALFVGGWFAWPTLKIWHWEVRLRSLVAQDRKEAPLTDFARGNEYMTKLACAGPQAYPAYERLLGVAAPAHKAQMLEVAARNQARWAIPLVVEMAEKGDAEVISAAVEAAERLADRDFFPRSSLSGVSLGAEFEWPAEEVSKGRRNLFSWWNREGKAKYAGGGE